MKVQMAVATLLLSCAWTAAQEPARKTCEDLKAEITKKLEAKGVTSYSLDVMDKGKESEGKVVGSCDGGTKSVVYKRGGEAVKPAATEEKKPQ